MWRLHFLVSNYYNGYDQRVVSGFQGKLIKGHPGSNRLTRSSYMHLDFSSFYIPSLLLLILSTAWP